MTSEPSEHRGNDPHRPLAKWDDLPIVPEAPPKSAWGTWGPDDVFGCLNHLGPAQVRQSTQCVERGDVYSLNLELDVLTSPMFRRSSHVHVVHDTAFGHEDELNGWNPQTSTQWDGFRHVKHPQHGYWNGVPDEMHGVDHWARRGIVGRGVLADVATWRASVGRPIHADAPDPISAEDIASTLDAQATTVETGDVLLIRTGWLTWYRSLDAEQRDEAAGENVPTHCGIRPGEQTSRYLWDLHVAAVATDNPGFEVMPPGGWMRPAELEALRADPDATAEYFLHTSLLPLLGIPIGELFALDDLAAACAADKRYTFMFTSSPLNIRGGVATPPNALAIR